MIISLFSRFTGAKFIHGQCYLKLKTDDSNVKGVSLCNLTGLEIFRLIPQNYKSGTYEIPINLSPWSVIDVAPETGCI